MASRLMVAQYLKPSLEDVIKKQKIGAFDFAQAPIFKYCQIATNVLMTRRLED